MMQQQEIATAEDQAQLLDNASDNARVLSLQLFEEDYNAHDYDSEKESIINSFRTSFIL